MTDPADESQLQLTRRFKWAPTPQKDASGLAIHGQQPVWTKLCQVYSTHLPKHWPMKGVKLALPTP